MEPGAARVETARPEPAKRDRRALIARAAVDILGRDGSRSLTHRAVDRELALPPGTTSAYFSKRIDLLRAAFRFLLDRDFAILDEQFATPLLKQPTIEIDVAAAFVDDLARRIMQTSEPAGLARYECYLMAARDTDFADILSWMFSVRERHWVGLFEQLRADRPGRAAATFQLLLRGIFHTNSVFPAMNQMTNAAFFRRLIVLSLSA